MDLSIISGIEVDYIETNSSNISEIFGLNKNFTFRGEPSIFPTKEGAILFSFILMGVVLTSITVFGIFGNVLSLFVLIKKEQKSSLNTLLTGLAGCDLYICVLSLLGGIVAICAYFEIGEKYIRLHCEYAIYNYISWIAGKFKVNLFFLVKIQYLYLLIRIKIGIFYAYIRVAE